MSREKNYQLKKFTILNCKDYINSKILKYLGIIAINARMDKERI